MAYPLADGSTAEAPGIPGDRDFWSVAFPRTHGRRGPDGPMQLLHGGVRRTRAHVAASGLAASCLSCQSKDCRTAAATSLWLLKCRAAGHEPCPHTGIFACGIDKTLGYGKLTFAGSCPTSVGTRQGKPLMGKPSAAFRNAKLRVPV